MKHSLARGEGRGSGVSAVDSRAEAPVFKLNIILGNIMAKYFTLFNLRLNLSLHPKHLTPAVWEKAPDRGPNIRGGRG